VLNNYQRWQQMTPQQRGEFRRQWHQGHPPGPPPQWQPGPPPGRPPGPPHHHGGWHRIFPW
jgi:hypothetical protein